MFQLMHNLYEMSFKMLIVLLIASAGAIVYFDIHDELSICQRSQRRATTVHAYKKTYMKHSQSFRLLAKPFKQSISCLTLSYKMQINIHICL